jgi:hypothetical protein
MPLSIPVGKEELIHLLKGIGPPVTLWGQDLRQSTLLVSKGNQWNEQWEWNEEKLNRMDEIDLYAMYLDVKNKR